VLVGVPVVGAGSVLGPWSGGGGALAGSSGAFAERGVFAERDIYYPPGYLGTWRCVAAQYGVETPLGEGVVADRASLERARSEVGERVAYLVRFVRDAKSGKVVADRGYNARTTAEAYMGPGSVSEVQWDPDRDPGDLVLYLTGGTRAEIRVTQRSFGTDNDALAGDEGGGEVFDTSEYVSQTVEPPAGSGRKNSVKASRTVTRYRAERDTPGGPVARLLALQRTSMFLLPEDPGYLEAAGRPVVVYKTKLLYEPAVPGAKLEIDR